ncbi:MAG TPA: bifunctional dTDP-4-dehydrorhamnose 3,5-epimerase family protein/NAD(P)-dependent oxidoreductase [Candidatus Saccharimonadaceae bacterium]|nr:bifunctional dTDP-4-dehydrorhamnose 3,5-epimerase family protein/NAD(P)-dependent oxidoreductase [Candidatus Saccharimonadaceae bacterium]
MSDSLFSKDLAVETTNIPGLLVITLPVHGDNRGWFKENWQREKMVAAGLPDFGPIQNNMSYNEKKGVTRGIHAEPWDKYVSVGTGRIFGAWVDLREGDSFGQTFTVEVDPSKAVFVPRGVGNAFQVLEDNTLYSYLVNDHWSADNKDYAFLNLADKTVAIDWPISLDQAELSEKDKVAAPLADVTPIKPKKVLIIGAYGQLGKALTTEFPDAELVDRDTFDMSDPSVLTAREWRQYGLILNAAAYTAVDLAETDEGRKDAWKSNATALSYLARISNEYGVTVVHISSDYVFDGTQEAHTEDEPFNPLSVYGQTKAAGDIAISAATKHYIFRTSWVIGDGKNFVLTMKSLAEKGVKPAVVDDQVGRLTFTKDLAAGIKHIVSTQAPYGTYNLTNDGEPVSWAAVAKIVYESVGKSTDDVIGISTEKYYEGKGGIAPRPLQSTLNIDKIQRAGFAPRRWDTALREYLEQQHS